MTGWQPVFERVLTGQRSGSIRELVSASVLSAVEMSRCEDFFSRYSKGLGFGGLTPFMGIVRGPGPLACRPAPRPGLDLATELMAALPDGGAPVHVAVSGGVDSWLLVRLLQLRGKPIHAWFLETRIPGYCERDRILALGDATQTECHPIPVDEEDFQAALRDFVRITETPIYGLHPVSKLLLARELRRRGVGAVVTGDGADQVARWDEDCDLLPLTIACFRAEGPALVAPFLRPSVAASFQAPDPAKASIRALAERLGLPALAKSPTVFPAAANLLETTTQILLELLEANT